MNQDQLYTTVDGLRQSGSIIFEIVTGSHAYGTNTPQSDVDLRGLFILPKRWHLSIFHPPEEVAIDKQDIKFYELKKFVTLAVEANPTIVEMLWPPEDCIKIMTPAMQKIMSNRHLFITKKIYYTHAGYAFSQISKAKGQNKMVHDEGKYEPGIAKLQDALRQTKTHYPLISIEWIISRFGGNVAKSVQKGVNGEQGIRTYDSHNFSDWDEEFLRDPDIARLLRPRRKNFCWFIPTDRKSWFYSLKTKFLPHLGENKWPVRPESLEKSGIDLSKYHAAALEHIDGVYRLYYYGDCARGVFRGQEGVPVLESIPIEDEWSRFRGLLIYNDNAYNGAVRDWERYFEWRANRNEARWSRKDGTNFDFDHKNMMHCMRLLLSAENLLIHGEPIVRFRGPQLEYLRGIRNGEFSYERIMSDVEKRMSSLETLKEKSDLPHGPDKKKINLMYLEIIEEWDSAHK